MGGGCGARAVSPRAGAGEGGGGGGGGEGSGGGWRGCCIGAAIEHYFLFSFF